MINNTLLKNYSNKLTVSTNRKGVLDIDTVKGCTFGMKKYPDGGCYGLCYAAKTAYRYGMNFSKSIVRKNCNKTRIERDVMQHPSSWFRIGTMGEPSYDWDWTVEVCQWLSRFKVPVIITKYWKIMSKEHMLIIRDYGVVVNISISPLDAKSEIKYRINTFKLLKDFGIKSILRVVSVKSGITYRGQELKYIQDNIFKSKPIIDNPLRIPKTDNRVVSGDIIATKHNDLGGGSSVSVAYSNAYLGLCSACPDQCGVDCKKVWIGGYEMDKKQKTLFKRKYKEIANPQLNMFTDKIEFEYVKSVIGSGYEEAIAKLAIEDKVAYRAARKNMQIHSAIVLKINGEFSGFFTFQVNHKAKEFCLLQSAMGLDRKNKAVYQKMVKEIIKQNTYGYPMIMTVSTKHDLERPQVFEEIGFQTYLNLSGFEYMVYGTLDQIRMKRLAHATMTNAWTTTRADWLKMKKEWNEKIEEAGIKYNIPNPKFASRDGCWQGKNGYSNVVLSSQVIEDGKVKHKKGKSFNGNASVLDPVACEVILRFFMPTDGVRMYNPFGGGVQMGFIAGANGFEYLATEIRQNQCDANNALCQDFPNVKWIRADSANYRPKKKYDLIFACPPYYRVEKYVDYKGIIPEGELNDMETYEQFRDTLFEGYKKAIKALNNNCFFVVMTGDSRDKKGAYYGSEAEHELFFKEQGLYIYNKIVYLECEFTRLAHAKRTLDYRKFPKREQKIIVAYKGDMSKIKDLYPPLGRL